MSEEGRPEQPWLDTTIRSLRRGSTEERFVHFRLLSGALMALPQTSGVEFAEVTSGVIDEYTAELNVGLERTNIHNVPYYVPGDTPYISLTHKVDGRVCLPAQCMPAADVSKAFPVLAPRASSPPKKRVCVEAQEPRVNGGGVSGVSGIGNPLGGGGGGGGGGGSVVPEGRSAVFASAAPPMHSRADDAGDRPLTRMRERETAPAQAKPVPWNEVQV